jgi:NAD(P)-dependent dehydrogenase (short-subunit alcohol dehydrogenase family)
MYKGEIVMSLNADNLKNKVCVVTGSAKSIGFGVAKKYAEQGAKVAMIDIDPAVEKSAEELNALGYTVKSYLLNITDRNAVLKTFEQIVNDLGDIYALANIAGVVDNRPFEENDDTVFDKMFKVNVYGTAWCIQGALPSMKKNKDGKIINFASKSGKTGSALMGPYSAAKGAVIVLTQALAFEYAPYNIKINSICPGITDATGVWSNVSAGYIENLKMEREAVVKKFTEKVPLGRLTDIIDVVDFVFFLTVSGEYCTGQAFNVTGGREMH